MKNSFKAWLSLYLLAFIALLPSASLAQGGTYCTIAQLREQTPDRWTQTYETKWRTVAVDAPVYLPEVESVPVLKIGYPQLTENKETNVHGWDEVTIGEQTSFLSNLDPENMPQKVDGRRINKNPEAAGQWYSGFAPENTYVPLCDTTFGEICTMIKDSITAFGYDPADYDFAEPIRLWSQHWYYYGYKEDALPGHIFMEFYQKIQGLPILQHVFFSALGFAHSYSRTDEIFDIVMSGAGYDGYLKRMNHLYLSTAQAQETLAEDVPLCGFQQVMEAIEPMIQSGNIRKVYEARLGYVLYNEPGVYRERGEETDYSALHFYAKPVWQVNCLWVRSPKGELAETASYTTDERNSLDYYQFMVDAQTGKLLEGSEAKDRCEFKGFISWEDVN